MVEKVDRQGLHDSSPGNVMGAHFVTGSKKGDTLLHRAQKRKGGLHTTARPSLSG